MENITDILSSSQRQLIELLQRQASLSVSEAVDQTDLAQTTIRQHFDTLEQWELVESEKEIQGRGRPTRRFSLTERGQQLFPSQNGDVLAQLLEYLIREGYHSEVDDFIHRYWDERHEKLEEMLEGKDDTLETTLQVLETFLDQEGFLPEINLNEDGSVQIRECNCPLSRVVESTRLPCRLEARFLERVVGEALERVEYIPEGSPACIYEFSGPEEVDTRKGGDAETET